TPAGLAGFQFRQLLHGCLPGAGCHAGITDREVGAGDLKVDDWLALGLIPRVEKPEGVDAIGRAQADLFSGDAVVDVEPAAATTAVQTEPLLHSMILRR